MSDNETETWLGKKGEVRERIRRELEENRLSSVKEGWMEVPPSDETVENLLTAILDLHESLRPAYLAWWNTGKLEDGFNVENFTVQTIRQKLGRVTMSVVFTWFSFLREDPKEARRRFYGISDRKHLWLRTQPLN